MIGITTFGSALAVGLTLAAPIGPMALLLMRRALTRGWFAAMVTGLGIATGDASYGAVGALGMTSIATFLAALTVALRRAIRPRFRRAIDVVSGVFLILFGVRTATTR